jgi:hypothetical protein
VYFVLSDSRFPRRIVHEPLDTCGPSRYYLIDNWKFDPDEHDRNGLIRPVPKNAVWAEVGVYKGDFSQIVRR